MMPLCVPAKSSPPPFKFVTPDQSLITTCYGPCQGYHYVYLLCREKKVSRMGSKDAFPMWVTQVLPNNA